MLQPDLLAAFSAVVETKSFSRAANRLGIAQSSVSGKIAKLEKITGRRLLIRNTHEVCVTSDGEAMVAYGKIVLDLEQHAKRHFSFPQISGSIRLGLSVGIRADALPLAFDRLRDLSPRLHLTMETGINESLLKRFDDHEIDLLLGLQPVGQGRGDILFSEPMLWFGNAALVTDRTAPIPLAVRSEPSLLRRMIIKSLSTARKSWSVNFESDNPDTLRAAVLGGLGVTAVPKCFFGEAVPVIQASNLPRIPDVEFFLAVQPEAAEHTRAFALILREIAPTIFGRT